MPRKKKEEKLIPKLIDQLHLKVGDLLIAPEFNNSSAMKVTKISSNKDRIETEYVSLEQIEVLNSTRRDVTYVPTWIWTDDYLVVKPNGTISTTYGPLERYDSIERDVLEMEVSEFLEEGNFSKIKETDLIKLYCLMNSIKENIDGL